MIVGLFIVVRGLLVGVVLFVCCVFDYMIVTRGLEVCG